MRDAGCGLQLYETKSFGQTYLLTEWFIELHFAAKKPRMFFVTQVAACRSIMLAGNNIFQHLLDRMIRFLSGILPDYDPVESATILHSFLKKISGFEKILHCLEIPMNR